MTSTKDAVDLQPAWCYVLPVMFVLRCKLFIDDCLPLESTGFIYTNTKLQQIFRQQ